jgi:hypothetical protein
MSKRKNSSEKFHLSSNKPTHYHMAIISIVAVVAIVFLVTNNMTSSDMDTSVVEIEKELSGLSDEELVEIVESEDVAGSALTGESYSYRISDKLEDKWKYIAAKILYERKIRYLNLISEKNEPEIKTEICNNHFDDDGDGKTDCNQVSVCYSPQNSPKNICNGYQGQDKNKVLILALNHGHSSTDYIKKKPGDQQLFLSGNDACQKMFGSQCDSVEQHVGDNWQFISEGKCFEEISEENYLFNKKYRAVCTGDPDPEVPTFTDLSETITSN